LKLMGSMMKTMSHRRSKGKPSPAASLRRDARACRGRGGDTHDRKEGYKPPFALRENECQQRDFKRRIV
jgi:hypothetical protein